MRRITTALVMAAALLACGPAAHAQIVGFKLGASFSNLDMADDAVTRDAVTAFTGGGYLRLGLGERLGLQVEVLSVTKGSDIRSETPADNAEIRIEYVEIPLLLQIPVAAGETFAPYIYGGPTLSLEVRCRYTDAAGDTADCEDRGFATSSPDFGLSAGTGLALLLGPGILLLEGRYTWGLKNINAGTGEAAGRVRNRSAAVTAGFVVPIGRQY
ncbi:MAG TPA: outer membrane beta-barrel protein [Longimicrobiales bacterium]|nr:outer membrane beta-barrel protein [Longimicrobiales bacterium]